jgi:hypothetical protein
MGATGPEGFNAIGRGRVALSSAVGSFPAENYGSFHRIMRAHRRSQSIPKHQPRNFGRPDGLGSLSVSP